MTSNGKQFTVTREMLTAVAGISARYSKFAFVLFCYITNHLMTGPLGNSEFCFPRISMFPLTSSRETLRFSGNKIHCSPRDQSLSVYCCMSVHLGTSFCFWQQSSTTNLLVLSRLGPVASPQDLLCSISLSICWFFASEMKRLRGFLSCLQRQQNKNTSLLLLVYHRGLMRPGEIMLWFCFLSQ